MAFWNRKESDSKLSATGRPKDKDMATKKKVTEVEPVVTSAPAPESVWAEETPVERPTKNPLAELAAEFSARAVSHRREAMSKQGVPAFADNVMADVYEVAAQMAKGKMS